MAIQPSRVTMRAEARGPRRNAAIDPAARRADCAGIDTYPGAMPSALIWLIAALGLAGAEALTGDMFLLMLGGGALAAAGTSAVFDWPVWADGVVFLLVSVLLLVIVLGFFLPPVSIILMMAPIILPPLKAAGFDLIWFGVVYTVTMEIAVLTPPVGLNVYIIKGALGDRVSLTTIFKGVGWFVAVDAILLVVLIAWPRLITWLPDMMF